MTVRLTAVSLFAVLLGAVLGSCGGGPKEETQPQRADWIIRSHVTFLEADGKTLRAAPKEPLRLWMPYVVGDIYGAPNAGEVVPATFEPDLSFSLDLNQAIPKLAKALVPTAFSQHWMAIEPAQARIARLSPFVLPAEGIAPVGMSEWLDADTGAKLMLIYVDRPARVRGDIVYEGRSLRFDIVAAEAGYLWIRQPEGSGVFQAAAPPAKVALAVMPNP
ncbi:MAG TPA: hypothetical protein VGO61_19920 [Steroidobacteraceae bacterium]|jgi:hypothetical protein|nr:hypothetical protein [Steroidobacteraceae bacterium]